MKPVQRSGIEQCLGDIGDGFGTQHGVKRDISPQDKNVTVPSHLQRRSKGQKLTGRNEIACRGCEKGSRNGMELASDAVSEARGGLGPHLRAMTVERVRCRSTCLRLYDATARVAEAHNCELEAGRSQECWRMKMGTVIVSVASRDCMADKPARRVRDSKVVAWDELIRMAVRRRTTRREARHIHVQVQLGGWHRNLWAEERLKRPGLVVTMAQARRELGMA
ncbi:hypothetical protein DFH06DRAFT_1141334 [Mycena polygramma]|nr:hypothetical protein DFH06DRAFT_1141334 [Mycena polygramma]